MAEPPILAVKGVETFYGAIQALHGVDLEVAKGEIVTLIGANGAGKSTLLMTICGNPRARAGTIRLDGEDITALPTHEIVRRGVAQVPEGRRIFPRMSVFENLQMGATLADPAHFEHDLERVFAMFPRLAERRDQRGGTLSGGEQQMLAIGRALMSRPRLLLLDEPSLGLAPLIVRQIFEVDRPDRARGGGDDLPGRAERLSRAAPGRPRLRAGQRPDPAERRRPGTAGQRRGPRGLSRRRPRMSPLDTFMFDWFGDTLFNVLLFNLVVIGPASFAAGPCRRHDLAATGARSCSTRHCCRRRCAFSTMPWPAASCGRSAGFLLGWARADWRSAAFAYRLTRDAPDGPAVSLALPAQRLAGLGGAALI